MAEETKRKTHRRAECQDHCPLDGKWVCGEHTFMKYILGAIITTGITIVLLSVSTQSKMTDFREEVNHEMIAIREASGITKTMAGFNSELLRELRQELLKRNRNFGANGAASDGR